MRCGVLLLSLILCSACGVSSVIWGPSDAGTNDGVSGSDVKPTGCTDHCVDGIGYCEGNSYRSCVRGVTGCTDWTPTTPCGDEAICSNGKCITKCTDECTPGQQTCAGDKALVCSVQTSGCAMWGAPQNCPSNQSCTDGKCNSGCQDQCTLAQLSCSGNQVLGCELQSTGCTGWAAPQACPSGQICSGGACTTSCQNQCTDGAVKCAGDQLQTCGKTSMGCTDWFLPTACSTGQKCVNGQCTASCEDQCNAGQTACAAAQVITCAKQTNGCMAWSAPQNCPSGQTCASGKCGQNCANQCAAGQTACASESQIQGCVKQTNGCMAWSVPQSCPSGGVCESGQCKQSCTNQCVEGEKSCNGQQITTCTKQTNGCTAWSAPQNCPSGQACSSNVCKTVGSCQNQCASGEKKCVGRNQFASCVTDASGCLVWSPLQLCAFDQTCSGSGVCSPLPTCTNPAATVPVLVISYIPGSGGKVDATLTGIQNVTVSEMQTKISDLDYKAERALEIASMYHVYTNPSSAICSLDYTFANKVAYLEKLPISTYEFPGQPGIFYPDYKQILLRENICNWVDTKNVKQVWLWGYHHGNIAPAESNMAGPYGDVSNSWRFDDMPICSKTYVLYNYNFGRDLGEMLENHGHQLEAVLGHVDKHAIFSDRFVKPYGKTDGTINACGNVHFPPNGQTDYDWQNPLKVESDCYSWNPYRTGAPKQMDCNDWTCLYDGGIRWKLWWMQNMPGQANGLEWQGKFFRNWWEVTVNFDGVMASGTGLLQP